MLLQKKKNIYQVCHEKNPAYSFFLKFPNFHDFLSKHLKQTRSEQNGSRKKAAQTSKVKKRENDYFNLLPYLES